MSVIDIFNTTNKYDIIYADPPLEYKQSGTAKYTRGIVKK
nr:MAG TPA: adenine-specific methyltransferase [Herelleviridae sp.]